MSGSEVLIRVQDLVKTFRSYDRREGVSGALLDLFHRQYRQVHAVQGVSFAIGRGEMIGYIGANGAGKSTTLKILCGILYPTSGEVVVDGNVPWRDREAHVQRIGAVFGQRSQLWWDLAAGESLRLIAKIYGVPDSEFRERLQGFEEVLQIGPYLRTPVRKLSLGQKMRCELAAALLHQPPVLFLDEPTIGLDVMGKQSIREFLRRINQERGVTMILTTHDLREIEELCSRILILDQGRLVFDGSRAELRARAADQVVLRFQLAHAVKSEAGLSALAREGLRWEARNNELIGTLGPGGPPRAEVIREVLERYGAEVQDIAIEEAGIEAIVQRIYQGR